MSSTPVESASSAVIPAIGEVPVAQAGPVVNGDVIVAANEGDNTINTTQDSTTQADITQEDTTQAQDDTAQDSTTRDTSTQGTSTQGTSTQGTSTQGTTTQDTTTQADTTQAQDGATQDNNAQDNSSTDNHTVVSASTNNHTQLAGNATSGNVPMLVPGHALVQTSPAGPNIPPNPPQPSLPAQIVQDGTNNGPSKERFDYLKEKAIEVSKGRSRYARYVIKTIGLARWTRKHLKKMDACLEHLECRKLGSLTRMIRDTDLTRIDTEVDIMVAHMAMVESLLTDKTTVARRQARKVERRAERGRKRNEGHGKWWEFNDVSSDPELNEEDFSEGEGSTDGEFVDPESLSEGSSDEELSDEEPSDED